MPKYGIFDPFASLTHTSGKPAFKSHTIKWGITAFPTVISDKALPIRCSSKPFHYLATKNAFGRVSLEKFF